MSFLTNDLPETQVQWDALWQQIQIENQLTTDRKSYRFLTGMVMGITSRMSEMDATDPAYSEWGTFVNFVFDEWTVYDNLLNEFND